MNFLSVINNLDVPDLKDVLQYDKTTKQLTFISPEDGTKHTCYVNSMQALVNFCREYVAPVMIVILGGKNIDNVVTAVIIFLLVTGDYANMVADILKLAIVDDVPDFNMSYTYWLKAAVNAVQVLDTLEQIEGLWNFMLQIKSVGEGGSFELHIEPGQPAHINWGDGEFSESVDGSDVSHIYNKVGNYTISYKGKALPEPNKTVGSVINVTYSMDDFTFWTHQSLN